MSVWLPWKYFIGSSLEQLSGKLSGNKVIFLCKWHPEIASDLIGITYGNLDKPINAEQHITTWINNIKSKNINQSTKLCISDFQITGLYHAFQVAFKESIIDTFRVFAISTFKSVQMMRLMANIWLIYRTCNLKEKKIKDDIYHIILKM